MVRVEELEQGFAWRPERAAAELLVFVWQPTALPARRMSARASWRLRGRRAAWVDAARDLAASGAADAMVTGPVSKAVIVRAGGRRALPWSH